MITWWPERRARLAADRESVAVVACRPTLHFAARHRARALL